MHASASDAYLDLHRDGFPHSDIYGLTLARQLPVTYRSRAASFIASLESRHPPYALKFLIRKFILVVRLKTLRPNNSTLLASHANFEIRATSPAKLKLTTFV